MAHLKMQTNSTRIGTSILNNLIINKYQWKQLELVIPETNISPQFIQKFRIKLNLKENRSSSALRLLVDSEDLALRLSKVAEGSNKSYRCDIALANVTLGSYFWNGVTQNVADCDLMNYTQTNALRRFPLLGQSAILLPQSSLMTNMNHTSAGFMISSHFLDFLLPGKHKLIQEVQLH